MYGHMNVKYIISYCCFLLLYVYMFQIFFAPIKNSANYVSVVPDLSRENHAGLLVKVQLLVEFWPKFNKRKNFRNTSYTFMKIHSAFLTLPLASILTISLKLNRAYIKYFFMSSPEIMLRCNNISRINKQSGLGKIQINNSKEKTCFS